MFLIEPNSFSKDMIDNSSYHLKSKQQIEIENFDNNKYSSKLRKIIDISFKLSSITLCKDNQLDLYNTLRFINPFKNKNNLISKDNYNLRNKILVFICYILNIYYQLSTITIIIVHYLRDTKNEFMLSLDKKTSTSIRLNESDDLVKSKEYIKYLTNILIYLGDPIPSLNGTSMICFVIILMFFVSFCSISLIKVVYENYRLDFISFLTNPSKEISRIKKDLIEIINPIISSILTKNNESTLINNLSNWNRLKNYKRSCNCFNSVDLSTNEQISFIHEDNYSMKGINDNKIKINLNEDSRLLLENLNNSTEYNLVKPINLSKKYFDINSKLFYYGFIFLKLSAIVTVVILLTILIFIELDIRVSRRLENFNCSDKLSFSRKYKFDYLELTPLDTTDKIIFSNYCNETENYQDKIVKYSELRWIEFKYYNNINMMKTWFCLLFLCLYLSILIAIHNNTQIFSHFDRILWLNQIDKDLNNCIESIRIYQYYETIRSRSEFEAVDTRNDLKRFNVLNDITLIYLNYRLFFKQQRCFKKLSNLFIFQTVSISSITLFATYLIGLNTKANDNFIIGMIFTCNIVFYQNIYLLPPALMTSKIKKLNNNVMRLLGISKEYKLNSHILCLWRKNFKDNYELMHLYAPDLFGIYVTYENILTLEIYLAVFILAYYSTYIDDKSNFQ